MFAGAVLGAAVMHGLHAQDKPKAYVVSEIEPLDTATEVVRVPCSARAGFDGKDRCRDGREDLRKFSLEIALELIDRHQDRHSPPFLHSALLFANATAAAIIAQAAASGFPISCRDVPKMA
jgi:hypothetical protein